MPGPLSTPWARDAKGNIVVGKSALKAAGLTSGQGRKPEDPYTPDKPK